MGQKKGHFGARVARLSEEERRSASQSMEKTLLDRGEWKQASVVGLYLSLTDEPQTRGLLKAAWVEGKRVCLPKIDLGVGLTWWEVSNRTFPETGTLWEPSPDLSARRSLEQIELFVVPGRAFDSKGVRLGRGGGHYDRALSRRSRMSTVIGMFFAEQELEELPSEPHDIPLPAVITQLGWRKLL
ncbi:MAG: 5-formyltetrahydrofolate cyclo-ligase [Verrucomicrobia bacterium]|nr:5-formyltetrahydrofolate cyclo-ligase [Verrucomicrobiota bacterium]